MKHPPATLGWRRGTIATCMVMTACAAPSPAPVDASAPVIQSRPMHVAQLGHGRSAVFGWCWDNDCPRRTTKTLTVPPTPVPAPVAITPSAPTLSVSHPDSLDKGEVLMDTAARPARHEAPEPAQQLSVRFTFSSARLDAKGREALRNIAPRLAQATDVRLSGRTDSTGPAAANELLAKERAQAVRRELLALVPGIETVLTLESQGACCFVESNDSASGRARNRRVDILYRLNGDDPP